MSFDLDAYCRRIGYDGARAPTLETLRAVHELHPRAIPFENLDVLLRRPVRVDADSLQAKLVQGGRGGYCFEQNSVLSLALTALGFTVREMTGRIRYAVPDHMTTGRTHMMLQVNHDGQSYLADVGFGANVLTGPLLLEVREEQATPHEPFRVVESGGAYTVHVKIRGKWVPLYAFGLGDHCRADVEMGNWHMSTFPRSRFYEELVVTRVEPGRRLALSNNVLTTHRLKGGTERRVLDSAGELRDALTDTFRLRLPEGVELDAVLARFTNGAVQ